MKKFIGLLCIIAALIGAWQLWPTAKPASQAAPTALSVTTVAPTQKTLHKLLNATGMTIARDEVQVVAEIGNVSVTEILADIGDVVQKGQKLATLDGESLANQLAQLQADYDRVADDFSRVDAIKNTIAVTKQQLNEKRSALRAAKARLDDATLNVKRATVTAQTAGTIIERQAALGAMVNPERPLYVIAKDSQIEIMAEVPEAELHHFKVGAEALIKVSGQETPLTGKVRLIGARVDPNTRMATVRIALDAPLSHAVGAFADIGIVMGSLSGLTLPSTAIQVDDQGSFVWVVGTENKAERQAVTVLERVEADVIVDAIPPLSRVIARAGAFVKAGDAVQVIESAP